MSKAPGHCIVGKLRLDWGREPTSTATASAKKLWRTISILHCSRMVVLRQLLTGTLAGHLHCMLMSLCMDLEVHKSNRLARVLQQFPQAIFWILNQAILKTVRVGRTLQISASHMPGSFGQDVFWCSLCGNWSFLCSQVPENNNNTWGCSFPISSCMTQTSAGDHWINSCRSF